MAAAGSQEFADHHLMGWSWQWVVMPVIIIALPFAVAFVAAWIDDRIGLGDSGIPEAIAVAVAGLVSARMIWHVQRHVPDGRWGAVIALVLFALVGVACFFLASGFGVEIELYTGPFWGYVVVVAALFGISSANDSLARFASGIPTSVPTVILTGLVLVALGLVAANDRR